MRLKDLILLLVVVLSILTGILWPELGRVFTPWLSFFVMVQLFFSFLSIKSGAVGELLMGSWPKVLGLTLLKLILLPILVYFLFQVLAPSFSLAALLLTGISTGVVAPFISMMVHGETALVLTVVVMTSGTVPFTLPLLVKVLAGRGFDFPLTEMIILLAQVIFIPIIVGKVLKRLAPRFADELLKRSFPLLLIFFFVINLGVFANYADFFQQQPMMLVTALLVAVGLAALYLVVGLLITTGRSVEEQLAVAVCLGNMNNVLVLVFSSKFFGPLEATVAAMYMFPFFGLIMPMRFYRSWRKR